MTLAPPPELFELIYNGYKRGQSLIKLNRSIHYTNKTNIMNIKIYDLRPQLGCVPLSGPDRFCKAHPSQHFVGSMACGRVALWRAVGRRGGIALGHQTLLLRGEATWKLPPSCCPRAQSDTVQVSPMVTPSQVAARA